MRPTRHTLITELEVKFSFPGLAPGEHEVAYPKVAIVYDYTPEQPSFTPRGEYGPIDPPDPPEVNFVEVKLINGDGLTPTKEQLADWAIDYLDTDGGFNAACNNAYEGEVQ